jgi:hypothetical protein
MESPWNGEAAFFLMNEVKKIVRKKAFATKYLFQL